MNTPSVTIEQGGMIRLRPEELPIIQGILKEKNMSWEGLDSHQLILKLPQQYVGYLGFPERRIMIKPKHEGVTLSHILRIYYFLFSAEYSDIDTPMYDVESGNDVNLVSMYIKELSSVVHRGIPVSYERKKDSLPYVRGKVDAVETKLNMLKHGVTPFSCEYDDLSRNIDINQLLLAAAKKVERLSNDIDLKYAIRQFDGVDCSNIPTDIKLTRNTSYCKKAVSLAHMIVNDLTLSAAGEAACGESLLINFDRVFEDFIKKVLLEYSSSRKYTYRTDSKSFAICHTDTDHYNRSFVPDLLFDFNEHNGKMTARAVLDMKNKVSLPFNNSDVYEMCFYAQMLNSKKVILCYPANTNRKSGTMRFENEKFYLQKIYAVFMNLAGNTAKEFRANIYSFINRVEELL